MANDLETIRRTVEKAKQEATRLQGELDAALRRLKDEYGYSTLEAASKRLQAIKKEKETLSESIAAGLKELEENYGHIIGGTDSGIAAERGRGRTGR